MINSNPPPPPEGQPPPPTLRPVKSVVAITAGLKPDDRVILDGLHNARPGGKVNAEEWKMTPPAETGGKVNAEEGKRIPPGEE